MADPEKLRVMRKWPMLRNPKELKGFFGLTGYYRRFVKGYGKVVTPVMKLLKKNGFIWSEEASIVVNELKNATQDVPIMSL